MGLLPGNLLVKARLAESFQRPARKPASPPQSGRLEQSTMSMRNHQKGTVAVFVAIVLPVLLAALGLVFDNGQALDLKRREQKAADAAALAAAQELRRGNTTTFRKVALANADLNGMSDAEIEVFNPPKTGKRAGD